jgi:predicted exporter
VRRTAREAWKASLPWLAVAAVAFVVLAWRLQLTFDLSLFFPRSTGLEQEILLKQMESGPGSRFMLVGISGTDRKRLAEVSEQLRALLAGEPDFLQVQNGTPPDEESAVPPVIVDHRFVLADLDFDEAALRDALKDRLQDLAFGGGPLLVALIAADPFLSLLQILEQLAPVEFVGEPWFSADGQAVLMVETRASATDIVAQSEAAETIRGALASLDSPEELQVDLTGVGAFGVELQRTIRAEATWRSAAATLMLLMVLAAAYRRPRQVLLAAIPLGMGLLCGLAAVTLVFKEVHGITLAFGFTLLGIAIDYPLHLFSHARAESPASAIRRIWPTMRIGALSTLLAYFAIMLAGSRGLAQLGLFTAGGLVAAVATTRWWLPKLLPSAAAAGIADRLPERPRLPFFPALSVLLLALAATWLTASKPLWEDSLASLSPLPPERLLQDNRLRQALGTADMRYQLVLHDAELERLLQKNERLEQRLAEAVDDGLLAGWQSVSALLPSLELQQERLKRIPPAAELQQRLQAATAGLPFHGDAFAPFVDAAEKARAAAPLTPSSYAGTPLGSWLDAHLFQVGDHWVSLTFLVQPEAAALVSRVGTWEGEPLLTDVRSSSDGLLREFRNGAVRAVGVAALLMIGLLFLDRHRPRRVLWLGLTVAAALALTVALLSVLHGRLTVIHLVGLLLVFGLGLDYALFCSREESVRERTATRHALIACAASTVLAFGILGGSSIPLLRNLGVTVALGSAASFLVAWSGRGRWPRRLS